MGVARRPVEVLEGSIGMPCIRSARVIWVACTALLALACSLISASATSQIKDLANIEGVRQKPVDRLRPRRRPQRHRRYAQQHPLHQAIAAGDARAHGRQHPRRHHPHRQRRRGDGHRQSARLRNAGHADGRHGLPRSATPRICRAARCWSPPCSAPMANVYLRLHRARWRLPASRPKAPPPASSAA